MRRLALFLITLLLSAAPAAAQVDTTATLSDRQIRQRLTFAESRALNQITEAQALLDHIRITYAAVHARIVRDSLRALSAPPAPPADTVITPPAPRVPLISITAGNHQSGELGTQLPVRLEVQVLDTLGAPMQGVMVRWRPITGGGRMFGVCCQPLGPIGTTSYSPERAGSTGADGKGSVNWVLGSTPGAQSAEAIAEGIGTVTFVANSPLSAADTLFMLWESSVRQYAHYMGDIGTWDDLIWGADPRYVAMPQFTSLSETAQLCAYFYDSSGIIARHHPKCPSPPNAHLPIAQFVDACPAPEAFLQQLRSMIRVA